MTRGRHADTSRREELPRSWVPVPSASDFPLANLPYGIFSPPRTAGGEDTPRVGVAIGASILDLAAVAGAGLLDDLVPDPVGITSQGSLAGLLGVDRPAWRSLRDRVTALLTAGDERLAAAGLVDTVAEAGGIGAPVRGPALVDAGGARMHLPVVPGDYLDFFSSLHHVTNVGRLFRGVEGAGRDPVQPNWRSLPVGYHGRSSTVVPSGTAVHRPRGQWRDAGGVAFGPTRQLDFELEVGFVTGGPPTPPGEVIAIDDVDDHIYGFLLVNDWSARDIQALETRPLGPLLGKSFATSVSCWLVPAEAVAPYRVPPPRQDPPPLPHLRSADDAGIDLHLEAWLTPAGGSPERVTATNFATMYWTARQQLAHVASNGTAVRPGDLYASGTVSGQEPGTWGSLVEATLAGRQPLRFADGTTRAFLEDGDTVTLRGWCGGSGRPRVGFGEVTGTVVAAGA